MPRRQMTIDKAKRTIIDKKAENQGTLRISTLANLLGTDFDFSHLVSVKPSHTSLNLRCTGVPDVISLLLLDKDAGEETDKM